MCQSIELIFKFLYRMALPNAVLFVRNWPRCHHLYACDSYSLIVIEIGLRHQVLTQTIDSELLRLFVKC